MPDLDISNIHLLLVEDNPDYLELLMEELKDYGYQHIETARDADEAKDKLNQHLFEVIVADMRLGGDSGGGFVVFDEVQKRNITAAVIIHTANDTVTDCRRAFKKDAWDYISKNMKGDVLEALHESIQEAITYLNRWGNRKDEMWIKENKAALLEPYRNQYVAVLNNQVIEFAETEEALKERIRARKLPLYLPVIQKIDAEIPQPLSIAELIKQGESGTLEFKSTFRWDIKEGKVGNVPPMAVLKTIAAFLNTEGGTLLIGVEDNGHIFGLEKDTSSLKAGKQSLDGFELALRDMIAIHLGAALSAAFVNIRFEKLDNQDVCVVEVNKSSEGAFMEIVKGKGGQKEQAYFIRSGNQTQALDVKEMHRLLRLKGMSSAG
ncbi:MAG: hypothetical protein DRR19_03470 [Candidatus Parabeggiatoa sp. nov. 1]|nr:MAG: hypothetical protein DRR19_03470 [Gammaproteobacteria bacterium]